MKKLFFTTLMFFLILSGPAYGLYFVDVEPDNTSGFQVVYFQFDSDYSGSYSDGDFKITYDAPNDRYYSYAYAGRFSLDFYSDIDKQYYQFSAFGYCVDLLRRAGDDWAYVKDLSSDIQQQVAWLMNLTPPSDKLTNNHKYDTAALQLAIWDTIYSDGPIFQKDYFVVPSGWNPNIQNLYDWYDTAAKDKNKYTGNDFKFVDFQEKQDMIVQVIPEPATMVLLGIGLIGLAGVGARRRKMPR